MSSEELRHLYWPGVTDHFGSVLSSFQGAINEAQARQGVELTVPANELLLLPLIDLLERRDGPETFEADTQLQAFAPSVEAIIHGTASDPDIRDLENPTVLPSTRVLHSRFSSLSRRVGATFLLSAQAATNWRHPT